MLARLRRQLGGWLRLDPDLKHLDDGTCRLRFGDEPPDPTDLGIVGSEEW